jgi:signal peptidase I
VIKLGGAACSTPVPREDSGTNFIKRVVAGPGDEIYIKEGHVYRKAAGKSTFVREHDSYIRECGVSPECNFPDPIKIPAGHWFMMGDNRGESDDSRFWGPVPTGWIIGAAIATYWPPDRIGIF